MQEKTASQLAIIRFVSHGQTTRELLLLHVEYSPPLPTGIINYLITPPIYLISPLRNDQRNICTVTHRHIYLRHRVHYQAPVCVWTLLVKNWSHC